MVERNFTSGAERRSSFIIRAIFLNLPFCHFTVAIYRRDTLRVIHVRLDLICNEITSRGILIRSRRGDCD